MDNRLYEQIVGIEKTGKGKALMKLLTQDLEVRRDELEIAEGDNIFRIQGEIKAVRKIKESIERAPEIVSFIKDQNIDTQSISVL